MKELLGVNIFKVWLSNNEETLSFETSVGEIVYETKADCCSETWFADLIGVKALLGGKVYGVEILNLPNVEDGRSRQEFDEIYGYGLKTDKGDATIVFRNSSNGYYGGWLECVKGPAIKDREITEDFSA